MATIKSTKKNKMTAAFERRIERGKKKMAAKIARAANPDKRRWF